ncbi:cold shock and DUF1294 domain-containing protein [Methylomonas montana]|uniref:cold shock and DUF1294 domain-containing protein n=1 Tax=Methylomonas montana TaxID=3058963 RepID=UPI002657EEC5|nr:cold shock and DUF1294 domain-containing protein [Methylomonas montana]WKJ89960.1 cold shock and DUF1294 domain-containing protein [Methylomonas montana]
MLTQLYEGIIKSWKEDKGFGFIQPNGGGKDVFIHIRDLKHKNYRPQQGDGICYRVIQDQNGKTRAYDAFIKGIEISHFTKKNLRPNKPLQKSNPQYQLGILPIFVIATIPFACSIFIIFRDRNLFPFFSYVLLSLSIFLIYAIDKTKAHKNKWRIPENTLHFFELLGGWPGALIAQRIMRHKNKKPSFQKVFWIIVTTHITAWIGVIFFANNLKHLFKP